MFRFKWLVLFVLVLVITMLALPAPVLAQGADEGAEVVAELSKLVYALVGAVIGGVSVGATALLAVRFVMGSPVLVQALEGLALSFPAETKETLNMLGKLLTEVSDNIPIVEKVAPGGAVKPPLPGTEG